MKPLILFWRVVHYVKTGIIGEATVAFISQFRLDFGILGISGIDLDGSLLDYDYHEVQVKRAIIESSRQTLLVTDHSKFSRRAMVRLGSIADIEQVFTDQMPPEPILEILKQTTSNYIFANKKGGQCPPKSALHERIVPICEHLMP